MDLPDEPNSLLPAFRSCKAVRSGTLLTNFKLVEMVVPQKGFEPLTPSLRMTCSTG